MVASAAVVVSAAAAVAARLWPVGDLGEREEQSC